MPNDYHMIEYIHENPQALKNTLENNENTIQNLVSNVREKHIQNIVITGVGSSYTAAIIAAPSFRIHCPLPTHILPSTELGYYLPSIVDKYTLVISVSRSGERGFVVDAFKAAQAKGAMGVAMTGFAESLLAQNAKIVLLTCEGPEITFAKTKSVIACAGLLIRLALALAKPDDKQASTRLKTLRSMPDIIHKAIEVLEPEVRALMPVIQRHDIVLIGGTLSNYGTALEIAIKIPETSNIPTIAGDTGNILHKPWGSITNKGLYICLVSSYDLALSKQTLQLVGKYKAHRLCITEPGLNLEGLSDDRLTLPEPVDPAISGLVTLPPLQLLTYYWTIARGMNPDEPPEMRELLKAMLPPGREEPELRA